MARPRTDDPGSGAAPPVNNYDPLLASLNPFLWWKCNGPFGGPLLDSSGNGYTGTILRGVLGVPGPIPGNTAVALGGGAPYAALTSPVLPTVVAPWSINLWLCTTQNVSPTYNPEILCSRQGSEYSFDLTFIVDFPPGDIVVDIGTGASWIVTGLHFAIIPLINNGLWHMISDVVTTTSQTVYVDGVAATPDARNYTGALLCDVNHYVICGADGLNPAYTQLGGNFAEVSLFNYALTGAEIAALYAAS